MHFGISEYMRVEAFITASKLARTIAHKSNNNTGTSINSQTHTKEAQQVVTKCSTSTGSNNNTGTSTIYNTQAQQVGHKVCKSCASYKKSIYMKASKQAYSSQAMQQKFTTLQANEVNSIN